MENRSELSREEIFEHIEKELLSSSETKKSLTLPHRTKGNYTMAMLINLSLLFLVMVGGLLVYLRFRATEYNLVGKPESIKGLEEALYQELQKKIAQELATKEAELASTRARLDELEKKMSSYREELQKTLASDLEKRKRELEERYQQSFQQASAAERKKLLEQLEEEKRRLSETVSQEYARKEEEYRKTLLEEQKKLLAQSSNQQQALETARRELTTLQSDYEARLQALQQTNQQTINLLRAQLEGRQREEAFRSQIDAEFSVAMRLIREGKYEEAQIRLRQVSNLYSTKPKDIQVSSVKQALDTFFVEALQDYIRLKQGAVMPETPSVSLTRLKTLSEALQRGTYDKNPTQLEAELKSLAREMPEVFVFYSQYQDYLGRTQTAQLQRELREADNLYALKDYKAALLAYTALARKYPLSTQREKVFKRISESINSWQQTTMGRTVTNTVTNVVTVLQTNRAGDIPALSKVVTNILTNVITNEVKVVLKGDEITAGKLFTNALTIYQTNPLASLPSFVAVIEKQPLTSYVTLSLEYIQKIYETKTSSTSYDSLKKKQEEEAASLYTRAESAKAKADYQTALQLYQQLILRAPLSSYVDKSLENLDKMYYQLLVARKKTTEIEPFVKGRVMVVEGDVLTLSLAQDQRLQTGEVVKIYRRISDTEVEEVAKALITRVSQWIVQAKVQRGSGKVQVADLVVGE
ncbi:hypothetical protein [Thermospira aquatica]|uniref:Uncharacterized protein n=1 Tax=Thermospira aquatica TaxID=2828656 RepID=A0AAX3BDH5_9SPIR|nr:hypothetical protein [Thermospira aquatica]URA10281.1 hypothetical protein KDW03_00300 [Thermospira aquatica]